MLLECFVEAEVVTERFCQDVVVVSDVLLETGGGRQNAIGREGLLVYVRTVENQSERLAVHPAINAEKEITEEKSMDF